MRVGGFVVSFKAFEGREFVKYRVLRPSSGGIQFSRPDARGGSAHRRQADLNVPREHFLLVLHWTIEASNLNAGSACQPILVRFSSLTVASAGFRH